MGLSLRQLNIWVEACALRRELCRTARSFPKEERFELSKQLIRSARSTAANIAEGQGRYHYQENIQYCRQSRGSAYESYDHLTAAYEDGYISKADLDRYEHKIEALCRQISSYIKYLRRRKSGDT